MKILILGRFGWLGGMFSDYLDKIGIENVHCHHDINSLQIIDPDITHVVNFAASTDIDWCEKNKNRTFWNNVLGAQNVAKVCKRCGVKSVFISSACVLKSKDEYDLKFEDDIPSPSCFYTETKLMAEKLMREIDPNTLIVRFRLPISEIPHKRNLLNKLSTYDNIIDSQESMVIVEDLIPRILELITNNDVGVFHIANKGTISPSEIAILMGHNFKLWTKADLDKQMDKEARARRTTTIVGSVHGYLPPIRDRIKEAVNIWKQKI